MASERISAEKLADELLQIVADEGMVERENISLDKELAELQIASADMVMILMAIEEKYDVYISVDNELSEVKTVGDVLEVMTQKITQQWDKEDQPEKAAG